MIDQQTKTAERWLVAILAAVQFVNIVDFMMVMPLGPDFSAALGIPPSKLGLIASIYTLAASLAGIGAATILDRFERRRALCFCLFGLSLGTATGAMATTYETLLAARVFAGVFGGPATTLVLAILADAIPFERRGKALGAVMASFSAASVLGVPLSLELAVHAGWKAPFIAISASCLIVAILAAKKLPEFRAHLSLNQRLPAKQVLGDLLLRRPVQLAYLGMGLAMGGMFLLVPNISTFVQLNAGYPREKLGSLYLAGGAVSFFVMRLAGRFVDRFGAITVASVSSLLFVAAMYVSFIVDPPLISMMMLFILFMSLSSARNVSLQTAVSRIPQSHERAGFQSMQSAVQHFSLAAGSWASTLFLTEATHGNDIKLVGMDRLCWLAMAITLAVIPVMYFACRGSVPQSIQPSKT